jgi:hypothetical protein
MDLMEEQDILDAISILDARLRENGYTLGSHCAKGSAIHKLQGAIRYLEALLRDHPEQFDSCNYTYEMVRTS